MSLASWHQGRKDQLPAALRHYLPDLVYGANDGIITTFAVVCGVVGANLSVQVILILGFANLLADGFSMGASNFLSRRSYADAAERARRAFAHAFLRGAQRGDQGQHGRITDGGEGLDNADGDCVIAVVEGGDERLRDEPPAVRPEVPSGVGAEVGHGSPSVTGCGGAARGGPRRRPGRGRRRAGPGR